ncbi:MAG: hypothetical protein M1120_02490 [Patescibacteria group bacterium]|nr:hypothetical protein [Patescibacteria group bacterium]
MIPAQVAIKSTTQEFVGIEDIKDDLVLLKDGSCCLILKVTAINFGLLSEAEQDAIIYAYAGLLNSLSFSVQIVVRSKRKDITAYLNLLKEQEDKQLSAPLKEQIKKYRRFVENTVKVNNVLDKKFYIIIPFSLLELGAGVATNLISKKKGLPYSKSYILERAKTNLYPKRDHLLRQLTRLGLRSGQLTTPQLIQLFYDIFNPEGVGSEKIVSASELFTSPIIKTNAVVSDNNRERQPNANQNPAEAQTSVNQVTSMGA